MNIEQIKARIKADNQPRPVELKPGDFVKPERPTPITSEQMLELAGIFARLEELRSQPPGVVLLNGNGQETTSGDATKLSREAEMEELTLRLVDGLLKHASEFIGALIAMRNEYVPLCKALVPAVRHAQAMLTQASAPLSEAVQAEAAAKQNE